MINRINSLTARNKEYDKANLRQQSTINKLLNEKEENELTTKRLKQQQQEQRENWKKTESQNRQKIEVIICI